MAALKDYKAKRDFHHNGKHYPIGKAYDGSDHEVLLKKGLIEEGKGLSNVSSKHMPMRVEKQSEVAKKGA